MKTMKGGPTFDQERISFNLARLKKGGHTFELVVDPDAAIVMKENGKGSVEDVVKAEKVFGDAKKGLLAGKDEMEAVFGTTDFHSVAEKILEKGEIQLTTEHREKVRAAKMKQLITRIHRNAVDPKTGNPHPEKRIELAVEEAKVRIDEFKTVEQQLQDTVRKLQPIIPLKFATAHLQIEVPSQYAGKMYGEIKRMAMINKDIWMSDGSLQVEAELPAGIKRELIDMINDATHGSASIKEKKGE